MGLLAVASVAAVSTAVAMAAAGPPVQKNVPPQVQAVPGSGKGIVIGYATSLEAVPIVHVISDGIRAQAKRAGAKLIFCDTGGDLAKALDCAKTMKTEGVQGYLQFQHVASASPAICKAGPQGVPVIAVDIAQKPCQTSFTGVESRCASATAGTAAVIAAAAISARRLAPVTMPLSIPLHHPAAG